MRLLNTLRKPFRVFRRFLNSLTTRKIENKSFTEQLTEEADEFIFSSSKCWQPSRDELSQRCPSPQDSYISTSSNFSTVSEKTSSFGIPEVLSKSEHFTKSQKMMTYPCLKSVLVNFDPNLRIELSLRCPSLRSINQSTPLEIETLSVNFSGLIINSHKYYLQIVEINTNDVYIKSGELHGKKLPHQLRPFTNCSPGTYIGFENDTDSIEWATSSKDRKEAVAYLYERVLGNRNIPIKVSKLDINSNTVYLEGLRNLKLSVSELELDDYTGRTQLLSSIALYLDPSNFPLKCLRLPKFLMGWEKDGMLNHQVIQTAKLLTINGFPQYIHKISTRIVRVHLDLIKSNWDISFISEKLIKLIDHWLDIGKEVGTRFSFVWSATRMNAARDIWKAIRDKFIFRIRETQRTDDCFEPLKIPSRFYSETWVSIRRGSGYEWICNLEVRSL
ncbi:F-box C protein [Caenorhabditis elegans]|uniref:F-box C protein n=3 Tax=Caenorhabditis elegans TaxID=6239 RepID=Q95ZM4_CAEEL|nr:F-box C protein [Caenorhabditis elegans]CCD66345.1 F-box C protein [Caenorhabditis elegans]|eukprot:NP_493875.1 F-box C protein [Caenorhabditis elegans]